MATKPLIPIWVLYLERERARLQHMQVHLKELGVQFRIIEGIDGKTLTPENLKGYSKRLAVADYGRELYQGELGCAFSHIYMWELMIKEQLDAVLILEDDVRISRSLINILANLDKLPEDYEHINFSTKTAQIPFGNFITDIYRASNHHERPYSAGAYLLTRKGAQKLLKLVFPLYMPIDNYISFANIKSYGIYPKVAIHPEIQSTIGRRGRHPKPRFLIKKYQQLKDISKAILFFIGFTPENLVDFHLKINHAIGKLFHR
jgi:glycosyl transferase family 25